MRINIGRKKRIVFKINAKLISPSFIYAGFTPVEKNKAIVNI